MNNFKYLFIFLLVFTSCSDDEEILPSVSSTFSNLHAPQGGGMGQPITGDFTKFDFSTGMTTTDANEWDIAFRGTTIIVNGGSSTGTNDEPTRTGAAAAGIADGTFASVTSADISLRRILHQDLQFRQEVEMDGILIQDLQLLLYPQHLEKFWFLKQEMTDTQRLKS